MATMTTTTSTTDAVAHFCDAVMYGVMRMLVGRIDIDYAVATEVMREEVLGLFGRGPCADNYRDLRHCVKMGSVSSDTAVLDVVTNCVLRLLPDEQPQSKG